MIRCREIVDPISLTVGETFYSRATAVIFADQSLIPLSRTTLSAGGVSINFTSPASASKALRFTVISANADPKRERARVPIKRPRVQISAHGALQRSLAGRSARAPRQSWKHACIRDRQTYPPPHGGRGWAAAGHSFRTCALPQPSTTHAPLEVLWQPGPHPSAALAEPMPETIAKRATIKTIFISLFSLDTQAATLGKSWMFRVLPQPYSFPALRCSQDGVHGP
jgi:hypothetical protein